MAIFPDISPRMESQNCCSGRSQHFVKPLQDDTPCQIGLSNVSQPRAPRWTPSTRNPNPLALSLRRQRRANQNQGRRGVAVISIQPSCRLTADRRMAQNWRGEATLQGLGARLRRPRIYNASIRREFRQITDPPSRSILCKCVT